MFQLFQGIDDAIDAAYRYAVKCTGGGFDGFGINLCIALSGNNEGVSATADGTAGDSAQVAHVSDPIEHNDEGRFAAFENMGEDGIEFLILDEGTEGDDSLVIAPYDPVEALFGRNMEGDFPFFAGVADFFFKFTAGALLDHDAVDILSGSEGIGYGMTTENDVLVLIFFAHGAKLI